MKKRFYYELITILIGAFFFIVYTMPFIRSLVVSFMTWEQASQIPPTWIPNPFILENYMRLFRIELFPKWVINTLVYGSIVSISNILLGLMAGYSFALLRYPGRDLIFNALLALMMLPMFVTMVPLYVILAQLRLIDNIFALPLLGLVGVNTVFMAKQYFLSLPREFFEAAKLDGASYIRAFFEIALPMAKPLIITITVYQFLGAWNAFFLPIIVLKSPENFVYTQGLNYAFSRAWYVEYTPIIAGTLIGSIPTLLFFIIFRRFLIGSIVIRTYRR
ncbi:MAG: carbohydrate ABC transporter permease [Desulfurococcaceae archaeon]|jgi:multiple sugar transport system permease protein|nr:MAG: carbohydrate ABC transporter permease [Desulfurococcaceae archaeon]